MTASNQVAEASGQAVPAGYKLTEVGGIPIDWNAVQLREIFTLKNGYSFKGEFFSNKGPIVLTPGNFKLEGGLYFEERNTKRYSAEYPKSYEFDFGDLVVVMTDLTPDCNLLGKPAFVKSSEKVLHNQRIGKIERLVERWDRYFLYYSLLSPSYLSTIKSAATGSTVRHTSPSTIYSAWVSEPPKAEQTAIANALSDVDALISELEKLIAKKQAIKTATMQQLLIGRTRLPQFALLEDGTPKGYKPSELGEIPEDWEFCVLGDVCKVQGGFAFKSEKFQRTGLKVIRISNIQAGAVDVDDVVYYPESAVIPRQFVIKLGDALIAMSGATTGKVGIYSDEFVAYQNQRVGKFSVNSSLADSTFVHQIVMSELYRGLLLSQLEQGAQPNVSSNQLENIGIRVPNRVDEQTAIATILSDMDSEIQALQQRLAKTRHIKQGMMHELLTGKTRLVKPQPSLSVNDSKEYAQ